MTFSSLLDCLPLCHTRWIKKNALQRTRMPLLRHCARSFRIVLTVWLSVRSDFQCCPPTFANMYKVMPDVSIIIIQIVNGVNHANVRKAPACFWSRHHTSHSTLRSLKISNRKQQTHYRRDQSSFCLLHALLYVSPAISIRHTCDLPGRVAPDC